MLCLGLMSGTSADGVDAVHDTPRVVCLRVVPALREARKVVVSHKALEDALQSHAHR